MSGDEKNELRLDLMPAFPIIVVLLVFIPYDAQHRMSASTCR